MTLPTPEDGMMDHESFYIVSCDFATAMHNLAEATRRTMQELNILVDLVNEHHEQWLCEYAGQWPDKFTLLNRYVRTDCEPPFIFND